MRIVVFILSPFLFLLSLFWRKDDNIWLYGSWYGKLYKDNSKYLFEDANRVAPEINHIWIYKDLAVLKSIPKEYQSIYAYSYEGFLIQLKARVFICTLNSSDFIPFFLTPNNIIVQLWHGSPLKNIGIDSRKTIIRKLIDKIRFNTLDAYTLCLSPASIFDECFKSAFLLKQKSIIRASYPRNKALSMTDKLRSKVRRSLDVKEDEKLILYLPTHRNEGVASKLYEEVLKLNRYNSLFLENKIKFLIKPHFYEMNNFRLFKDLSSIKVLLDNTIDLYELLASSDSLVTDYSSVFFDFELLGKPICIYPFDIEEYSLDDRGMYFSPNFIFDNLVNTRVVDSKEALVDFCISLKYENNSHKFYSTIFNESPEKGSFKIIEAIKNELL
tara:strand:+ start:668 stop:1822 length:1155 start_codon:yes stop_codon:yes gene_type:complete